MSCLLRSTVLERVRRGSVWRAFGVLNNTFELISRDNTCQIFSNIITRTLVLKKKKISSISRTDSFNIDKQNAIV